MSESWLRPEPGGGVLLSLHVQPGAKRSEVAGLHGDALKIRLAAPPVEGKANLELIAFLAAVLSVTRHDVALIAGRNSRTKRVSIARITPATALKCLLGK